MVFRRWNKETETREEYRARLDKTIERWDSRPEEVRAQQMHQHHHNGHLGNIKRARGSLGPIDRYRCSLTYDAQVHLDKILQELDLLEQEVYLRRVNLDGSIREIEHKTLNGFDPEANY